MRILISRWCHESLRISEKRTAYLLQNLYFFKSGQLSPCEQLNVGIEILLGVIDPLSFILVISRKLGYRLSIVGSVSLTSCFWLELVHRSRDFNRVFGTRTKFLDG